MLFLHVEHDILEYLRSTLLVSNFTGNDALFDTFIKGSARVHTFQPQTGLSFSNPLALTELFDMAPPVKFV